MSETEKLRAAIDLLGLYSDACEKALNGDRVGVAVGYDMYVDRKATLDYAITALREKLLRDAPKPLTLDEIKEMKGKPIFTVMNNGYWSGWDVLTDVEEIGKMKILHWRGINRSEYKDGLGQTQYYATEPKGDQTCTTD